MQKIDAFVKWKFSLVENAASLTFYWLSGLMIGAHFSLCQGSFSTSLMQSVLRAPVSVVGLTTSVFVPFLLTVLAVYIRRTDWFGAICLFKAVAVGYCAVSLVQLFQLTAWVPCFLLLFSDCLYQVFLFWFWLRYRSGECGNIRFDCCMCVGVGVLIILLNYLFFIPVLQGIF